MPPCAWVVLRAPVTGHVRRQIMNAWLIASTKWGLAVAATVSTAIIAHEAATIPFLRGAGLAQADFELFVLLVVIGLPALAILTALSFVSWRRASAHVALIAWVVKNPLGILWFGNAGVQLAAWLFLLYIRAYGLHAVRL